MRSYKNRHLENVHFFEHKPNSTSVFSAGAHNDCFSGVFHLCSSSVSIIYNNNIAFYIITLMSCGRMNI